MVIEKGKYSAPHCTILIDNHGSKVLILDKQNQLPELAFDKISQAKIQDSDVVYFDFCPAKHTLAMAKIAKNLGKKIVLNFQQNLSTTVKQGDISVEDIWQTIALTDIFIPSRKAAIDLCGGEEDPYQQLKILSQKTNGDVVLTVGSKGIIAYSSKSGVVKKIDGFKINPVDTTGAGDALIGSLLYFYLEEKMDLFNALKLSNVAAALTCLKVGAQQRVTISNIKQFLKDQ